MLFHGTLDDEEPLGDAAVRAALRHQGQYAGQTLVVSGRSGTGKTTLLRTLAGEIGGDGQAVLIGGLAPAAYAPGQVVLVAADDYVFAGTVADNLRLADPGLSDDRTAGLLWAMCLTPAGITASTLVGLADRGPG